MNFEEYSKNNCLLCGKHYKHRIAYTHSNLYKGLKEAELITHCANCRALLRKHKVAKHKFDIIDNEINYLRYTNVIAYLENNNIIKYEEQDWQESNSY